MIKVNYLIMIHYSIWASILVQSTVISEDIDEFEIVLLSALVIVRIVSRGDLHATSTGVHINQLGISDNLHFSVRNEWVNKLFSMEMLVARIIWMNGHSNITKHGLRSCCCDDNFLVRVFHWVGEFPHGSEFSWVLMVWNGDFCERLDVFSLAFNIRKGGLELAAPVHQTVGSVDQSSVEESNKCFSYRPSNSRLASFSMEIQYITCSIYHRKCSSSDPNPYLLPFCRIAREFLSRVSFAIQRS